MLWVFSSHLAGNKSNWYDSALEEECKEQVDWSEQQEVDLMDIIVLIRSVLILLYILSKVIRLEIESWTEYDQIRFRISDYVTVFERVSIRALHKVYCDSSRYD